MSKLEGEVRGFEVIRHVMALDVVQVNFFRFHINFFFISGILCNKRDFVSNKDDSFWTCDEKCKWSLSSRIVSRDDYNDC